MSEVSNMSAHETNMDQMVEQLSKMTISQISQLTKLLEEKWGVKAVAQMAVGGPAMGAPASAAAEKPQEQTEFSVHLTNAGSNKIQVIKVIREITNLGLKEAKDLVDGAPKEVKAGVAKDEAESIKKKILEAGGTVEVK